MKKSSIQILAMTLSAILIISCVPLSFFAASDDISKTFLVNDTFNSLEASASHKGVTKNTADVLTLKTFGTAGMGNYTYADSQSISSFVSDGNFAIPFSDATNLKRNYLSLKDWEQEIGTVVNPTGRKLVSASCDFITTIGKITRDKDGMGFTYLHNKTGDTYSMLQLSGYSNGKGIQMNNYKYTNGVIATVKNGLATSNSQTDFNTTDTLYFTVKAEYAYTANALTGITISFAAYKSAEDRTNKANVYYSAQNTQSTSSGTSYYGVLFADTDISGIEFGVFAGSNSNFNNALDSITYEFTKTDAEYEAEVTQSALDNINNLYNAYSAADEGSKLQKADDYLNLYNSLTDTLKPNYTAQISSVNDYLKSKVVTANSDGSKTFKFSKSDFSSYPNVSEYIWPAANSSSEDNTRTNPAIYNAGLSYTATALFDKANAAGAGIYAISDANDVSDGDATSIQNRFGAKLTNYTNKTIDGVTADLLIANGDSSNLSATSTNVIYKSANAYGKDEWNVDTTGDVFKLTTAAQIEKYKTLNHIALSYTIYEITEDSANSRTNIVVRFKEWADNGDGVYNEADDLLIVDEKVRTTEWICVSYLNGSPRTIQFAIPAGTSYNALVSFTSSTKSDSEMVDISVFENQYQAVYSSTGNEADDVVRMYAAYQTLNSKKVSDTVKQAVEGCVTAAGLRPSSDGASVSVNINQSLRFYANKPSIAPANLGAAKATAFGAAFNTNYSLEQANATSLTKDNAAFILEKTYGASETLINDLAFTLTRTGDISVSENWNKYIVVRYYVAYSVDDNVAYVYSTGEDTRVESSVYSRQLDGVTVRCVSQILVSMESALYSRNAEFTADSYKGTAYNDKESAQQTKYEGKLPSEVYITLGNSYFTNQKELFYFLLSFKSAVGALQSSD